MTVRVNLVTAGAVAALMLVLSMTSHLQTLDQASGIDAGLIDTLLQQPLAEDEAYAWYLYHAGFAVKTDSKLLIFDYTRGLWNGEVEPPERSLTNGWVDPDEIRELDVYVFVSHSHSDHYDPVILGWQDTISSITYFFGWFVAEGPNYHNMVGPRASFINDEICVYTINSYHSGVPEVAFLVLTDDLSVYHGGDYNSDYVSDIAYLGTFVDRLDIAMLNDWCGEPILEVIHELLPNLVLPMHFGGDEAEPRRLPPYCVDCACTFGCADLRGDIFHYPGRGITGKIAFYSNRSGRDDIYLMDVVGGDVQRLTDGDYGGKCPDLSPEGDYVAFVSLRDGNSEIYVKDLSSGMVERLTNLSSVERQPRWSPDGSRIALQSNRDGDYELYVMDADGSNWTRLTHSPGEDILPVWSPDGSRIVFSSFRDSNWEIYTIGSAGSDLARLTESDDWETGASWSPVGDRIAFRSGPAQQFTGDIHLINVDGNNEVTLTDFDALEEHPEWSPDGDRIAFQTNRDGNLEIYVMDTLGANIKNFTYNSAHDLWPSWSGPSCCRGLTGNIDDDPQEVVDIGDLTRLIDYLFISFARPICMKEANCDGEGAVDIGDLTTLIAYLFMSPSPLADCP
ncbi:MAG: PD40 domain-containing protein [Candidatus Zixiibacteriota bacterium]|nr:MAG: PD40 domain-containing protein [candidate division Zixibacteria bacterium]